MKTGEVISATQVRDEYIETIRVELERLGDAGLVEKLVHIVSHFAYTIDSSDLLLVKVVDVAPEKPVQPVQPVQPEKPQPFGMGVESQAPESIPEELKQTPVASEGINPSELGLKAEYERKVREMNQELQERDADVMSKPEVETNDKPKKTNFFDRLGPAKHTNK